jgi:hypothetical protein
MLAKAWPRGLRQWVDRRGRLLGRVAVALAVLAASVLLAPLAATGERLPLLAFGAIFGLIGLGALLRWPGLGFPLLVTASLVVPFSIGTGTQSRINISLLLVAGLTAVWVLDMLAHGRGPVTAPGVMPALALVLAATLALGFGQFLWTSLPGATLAAQLGGYSIFVLSAAAFLWAVHRLDRPAWLQAAVWIFLVLGAMYILSQFVPAVRRPGNRAFGRAVQDSMFWAWWIALSFSQAWLNRRLAWPLRLALGALSAASLYVTVVIKQTWTSGWLPAATAVFVIVLLKHPRVGIALGVLGALGLLLSNVLLAGDNSYSLTTRLAAWRILWELIKLNPILGLGPSNYYFFTPLYDILGYYVRFNSHNNYVDIVAQVGLAGLACYLWFAWQVGWLGLRLRHQAPEGFEQAYVYGALGGLAAMLVAGMLGDWVLPFVYNVGLEGFRAAGLGWLFLGGMVALSLPRRGATPLPGPANHRAA